MAGGRRGLGIVALLLAQSLAGGWACAGGASQAGSAAVDRAGDGAESPVDQAESLAERGYRLLRTKPFLPPDFDDEVFDNLWRQWEEPLRSQAEVASTAERRRMALARYGLTDDPNQPGRVPLQYVDAGGGNWAMSCLACHTGKVAGRVVLGAPNSLYDLQTLTEEVRATKSKLGKEWAHMDIGSLATPLSASIGTTNAVMFGKLLLTYRDADLNVLANRVPPRMLHHDHDPPPLWHFSKKTRLYADSFAPKGHRPLMQFLLVPKNGPKKFHAWEDDFRAVYAWLESLEAPAYPYAVDEQLARQGQTVFEQRCAECHGTYGAVETWPERIVPIEELGTDRRRLDALTADDRARYGQSWLADYGSKPVIAEPGGYVAPPLDGIWASAPYLHNGSVPTLWHLLHAAERPVVWRRTEDGYDTSRVGLEVRQFEALPSEARSLAEKRRYFDTRIPGKSAAGHTFPELLSESEKRALLEYLKTL